MSAPRRVPRVVFGLALGGIVACAAVTGLDDYVLLPPVADGGPPSDARPVDVRPIELAPDVPMPPDVRPPVVCPPGTSQLADHCYLLVDAGQTQPLAKLSCAEAGAHLVTVRDAVEEEYVARVVDAGLFEPWIGLEGPESGSMNRRELYTWVTGEPMTYDAWAPTDPNIDASCIVILNHMEAGPSWADRVCTEIHPAICEQEPPP